MCYYFVCNVKNSSVYTLLLIIENVSKSILQSKLYNVIKNLSINVLNIVLSDVVVSFFMMQPLSEFFDEFSLGDIKIFSQN